MGSIDKPRIQTKDNIIYGPAIQIPKVKGMGSSLFDKMLENKDVVAQIDGLTEEKDTYGQLLQRCTRAAIKMREIGIKPEDVTATCCKNHLNSFVPMVASLFLGAIPTALHPVLSVTETIHLLRQVKPKIIFVDQETVELFEDALQETKIVAQIVVFGQSKRHLEFSEFLLTTLEKRHFIPVEVKDVKSTAIIAFSSGTTGMPKGVCLSHLCLVGLRDPTVNPYNLFGDLLILGFTPIFWISSILTFLIALYNKYTRLVLPEYDPDTIWGILDKFKVNALFLQPNIMLTLCRKGRPKGVDTSKLLYSFVGGSAVTKAQILEIVEVMETPVVNGYALTEFGGAGLALNAYCYPSDFETLLESPHTLGKPLAGFAYKVADLSTGKALGPHKNGELRIKTEFQMSGYYNLDSAKEWDSDGFLKTGDIVYYDEDYNFYFVDRCKELIKLHSWHITPTKIERVLLEHPAVESAVVIGVPHDEDGEQAVGVVVLQENASGNVTEKDLEKFVSERVDEKHKLRGGVKFIKSIPMTPTGKPLRRQVKHLVLQGEI